MGIRVVENIKMDEIPDKMKIFSKKWHIHLYMSFFFTTFAR